jgi:hypothetical protein
MDYCFLVVFSNSPIHNTSSQAVLCCPLHFFMPTNVLVCLLHTFVTCRSIVLTNEGYTINIFDSPLAKPMQTYSSHVADTEYLVRQAANTGYQWSSLLLPPAYIAYVTARRGRGALSLNKVLRATWVGGFGGTAA